MPLYTCPMHPDVVSDKPDRCPKCGMRLVPQDKVKETPMMGEEDKGLGPLTWKSYLPLMTIIGVILFVALSLGLKDGLSGTFSFTKTLSYFMIGFFLTFGTFKLMDLKGFAEGYSTYDLLAKRWFAYGYIYPFLELGFGLSMIFFPESRSLLAAEFLVMAFSGIGVAQKLLKGEKFQCVCLGTFLKVPLTKVTLIEDFGMAILALIMFLVHQAPDTGVNSVIFGLHSPAEFRYLSSLGHWIAGYIFGGVAIIALIQAFGFLKGQKYLWPALITVVSFVAIPYTVLHHGLDKVGLTLYVFSNDPQQRQHIIMFLLIFLAGTVELLIARKKLQGDIWKFVLPSVFTVIGLLFFFHPQHGTAEALRYSILYHKTLGAALLLTGIFKGIEVRSGEKYRWAPFVWIIFLIASSVLLVLYHEPAGTYQRKTNSLSIIQAPNSILNTVSEPVTFFDNETKEIALALIKAIQTVDSPINIGLGLAAPQLGFGKRIIALKKGYGDYQIMVNPEVLEKKWLFPSPSRCFSLSGIHFVKRYFWYKVKYQDIDGKYHEEIVRGPRAATLHQEIDHLDGVLLTDY